MNKLRKRPVVYDANFFAKNWFIEWNTLQFVLASLIESEPKWRTILDFGCGPGIMIDLMTDRNLKYVGCDYSAEARQLYLQHFGKHPTHYLPNLDNSNLKEYDLLLAFDVLEHMKDDEIAGMVKQVSEIPELLFNISRTRGIPGHINIKSDRAWIAFMKEQGYSLEERRTLDLRKLYSKKRPGSPDLWDRNLFLFKRTK